MCEMDHKGGGGLRDMTGRDTLLAALPDRTLPRVAPAGHDSSSIRLAITSAAGLRPRHHGRDLAARRHDPKARRHYVVNNIGRRYALRKADGKAKAFRQIRREEAA
jgi:hypothetical protein